MGATDKELTSVISQVMNDVAKERQQYALTIGHTYIEILVGDTSRKVVEADDDKLINLLMVKCLTGCITGD